MKYIGENAIKKLISLIKSDLKKKLDKNQGTANAGKTLVVGEDGNVVPGVVKDGFCIIFTDNNDIAPGTVVADKTLAEIQQALNEGKVIYGIFNDTNKEYLELIATTSSVFVFQTIGIANNSEEIIGTRIRQIAGEVTGDNIIWHDGSSVIPAFTDSDKEKLNSAQPLITATGLLEGDGTGNIIAADTEVATLVDVPNGIVKGDGSTLSAATPETDYASPIFSRKVTLTVTGWYSSTKQQTVACAGILADITKQELHPNPVDTSYDSAWNTCGIQAVAQGANSVTFQCSEIPTTAVEVFVTVITLSYKG